MESGDQVSGLYMDIQSQFRFRSDLSWIWSDPEDPLVTRV